MVGAVLTRNNTLTGVRYGDDPAVLAWELGNELTDVSYGYYSDAPPPSEWSDAIGAFVKEHATQLVMDGAQFSSASLALSHVDLVGRTYYNVEAADVELVRPRNRDPERPRNAARTLKSAGLAAHAL
eukprot:2800696-Prymnesium_polylepis.1